MTLQHTPTPWRMYRSYEEFQDVMEPEDIAAVDATPHTSIVGAAGQTVVTAHDLFTFRPGDAEFIVKACNAHDELMLALREFVASQNMYEIQRARALASAALAKVTP